MKTLEALPAILRIAKFTFADEIRQKSFVIMFAVCALSVFLVRGCYHGSYMVNGQSLDAGTVVMTLSRIIFHVIAACVLVITALLSMRIFRRDRTDGLQAFILSKPIARWQYVSGKVFGVWCLSVLFMFALHGIMFLLITINLQVFMPEYLIASLICALNLFFVVCAVLLLSLLMPDIIAFLGVLGVGVVSFVADTIAAASHSQFGQMLLQQSGAGPHSDVTWWKIIYFLWPKLLGVQQSATLLLSNNACTGFDSLYPVINIFFYSLILCSLLFLRFKREDIV